MIRLLYILLIIFAIMSIQTSRLQNAIVYLGIFSFVCSFCYLLLMAPDVAIAEAVIGCTLSTVLYLVAIKRYRIFRIYFCDESDKHYGKEKYGLIPDFTAYAKANEIQIDIIDTHKNAKYIRDHAPYDVIVEETLSGTINIYSDLSNYLIDKLVTYMSKKTKSDINFIHITSNNKEEA